MPGVACLSFSDQTLLAGHNDGHPVCTISRSSKSKETTRNSSIKSVKFTVLSLSVLWLSSLAQGLPQSTIDRYQIVNKMPRSCTIARWWSRSVQRETGLSNASHWLAVHACVSDYRQTVSIGNLIRMQCRAAEPHRLLHRAMAVFRTTHCACVQRTNLWDQS